MQNKTYSITEASEMLELENHTLRYYEDELELNIPRNSIGHRYYREYDIKVFQDIIGLKAQGLQLKAIKGAVQSYYDPEKADRCEEPRETYMQAAVALEAQPLDITDTSNRKVEQFRLMMKETFVQAIYENQDELKSELNHHIEYKIEEFESKYQEKDKERYRKLDETMREMQKIRAELVDIKEEKEEKKSFFGRLFKRE